MTEMRPIPGYEGYYSITRDGRVWSHDRTYYRNGKKQTVVKGRWLNTFRNSKNGKAVQLRVNDIATTLSIRKTIIDAFKPNYGKRPKVEVMK